MELQISINTDEFRQVMSGATSSIIRLDSRHLNRKLHDQNGREIQFEEITAVCSAGRIQCQPRIFRSVHTCASYEKRPVVVFRARRKQ